MSDRPRPLRNARLFLLIAVLAHGLGGDFGAWFDRHAASTPLGHTVHAQGSSDDCAPTSSHPRDCAVCQNLANGHRELPERGLVLRAGFAAAVVPGAEPRTAPRFLAAPPSLPRGPPALS